LTLAGCTVRGEHIDLTGQDVRLTVLHTSDIHSRILPFDFAPLKPDRDLGLEQGVGPYGGAARLAALIRRERARAERVIHVDSGDIFQGAPIFNAGSGEVEMRWLSLIGVDAVVVGNHEFDKGVRNFAYQAQTWATFPLLAANYLFDSSRDPYNTQLDQLVKPFTVVNAKGLTIGIIGMGNLSSLSSIGEGGNSLGITPLEQNETLRRYVGFLRGSVDLLMVVSHLGLREDQEIVNGYDAYYTHDQARPFLCPPGVEPTPPDPCWKVLEDLPDRYRVFIPGVSGIDVVMGGHHHITLNPPQVAVDPAGREVIIAHSGAFTKYLGRLDLVVRDRQVIAHDYRIFPVDSAWCADPRPIKAGDASLTPGYDAFLGEIATLRGRCMREEDAATIRLLQPYIFQLDYKLDLPRIFAYAPRDVNRRSETTGGDSPLGDLTAASMAVRRRSEAQFAMTNSLGIRDSLYSGPIKLEDMFNVFPFENIITTMYLSGAEVQELFDFVTERSAGRGCQSQAQIAGAFFVMDCAQDAENLRRRPCSSPADCYQSGETAETRAADNRQPWDCLHDEGAVTGRCWSHPAPVIRINGQPLALNASYKIAVNDFISRGGSGFKVLKRNTTRVDTGISLRDGLIDYLRTFCTCQQLERGAGGCLDGGQLAREWCAAVRPAVDPNADATTRDEALALIRLGAGDQFNEDPDVTGGCTCLEAKHAYENPAYGSVDENGMVVRGPCSHITRAEYEFCSPSTGRLLTTPVVVYDADGRIERRVK
jgi:2',3'-cyclic-nucleotide 2'-phosphodiesterase (5'-nucleotidase family)